MKKKIISLLTAIAVTLSMIPSTAFAEEVSIYADTREFTNEEKSEQKKFDELTEELFKEYLSGDFTSARTVLSDPVAYGIENMEPSFTIPSFTVPEEEVERDRQFLKDLDAIDYDALTYQQQLDYDTIKTAITNGLTLTDDMFYLSSALSMDTGAPMSIIQTLCYLPVENKTDAENLVKLANTAYDYAKASCDFEWKRLEKGFSLSQNSIDTAISECEAFVNANPNSVLVYFEQDLGNISVTEEEKQALLADMSKALENNVIPAMKLIIDTLKTIDAANVEAKPLACYEGGREYYDYLLKTNVGTTKTAEEIIADATAMMYEVIMEIVAFQQEHPEALEDYFYFQPEFSDPTEIINLLIEKSEEDFPTAYTKDFTVEYLPESLQSDSFVAFYLLPQFDNIKNSIYANGKFVSADNASTLGTTLAHEGVPGHMYQMDKFAGSDASNFRKLLGYMFFTGYAEGWTSYVEYLYAPKYLGMSENGAYLNALYGIATLLCYNIIDVGMHGLGWSCEETVANLSGLLYTDDILAIIYDDLMDIPATYACYAEGIEEVLELRTKAEERLGENFDDKEFHRFYVDTGITDFGTLETYMNKWMDNVENALNSEESADTSDSSDTDTVTSETEPAPDYNANPQTGSTAILLPVAIGAIGVILASRKRRTTK